MKKILVLLMIMIAGTSVFAEGLLMPIGAFGDDDYDIYKQEAAAILEELDADQIGELTLGDIKELSMDLSIPFQKMQYVKESRIASAVFPGFGQYMNDDALSGTLFMLSNIAVITGTAITAYYLLPDELRFDSLNYFRASSATISERWDNQSFNDLLPTMGVVVAGFVVDGVIRLLSAEHAGKLAQKNIAEGKIQFEPKIMLPVLNTFVGEGSSQGGFGFGMGMSF